MGRPPLGLRSAGNITTKPLRDTATGKVRAYEAHARVRDLDGVTRQVRRKAPTKAKAEAALKDALAERSGPTTGPLGPDSRYEQVAAMWIEHIRANRAATTHDTYRRELDAVVLPRLGQLRLREITTAHVAWLLEQLSGHRTPNGLRAVRKVISGPLTMAARWQLIDRNPCEGLAPISGRAKKSRALTRAEQETLLRFVDTDPKCRRNDLPDLVRFLLGTGCRIGEALGLRWRDVDLAGAQCTITGGVVRVKGVGLVRDRVKTDAGERRLFLPEFVVLALRMRFDGRDMDGDWPVFPSGAGGWRDLNNMQRLIRHARTGAGLGWMTSHTARRTAATILDEAGLSPRQIADQLGHARPSMSQDVYVAREGSNTERAARALDARYSPARP